MIECLFFMYKYILHLQQEAQHDTGSNSGANNA